MSSQPAGHGCTVANGSGTVTSAVTNVAVACTTNTYSISGNISGLLRGGLVLTDNTSASLPISPGAARFAFAVGFVLARTREASHELAFRCNHPSPSVN